MLGEECNFKTQQRCATRIGTQRTSSRMNEYIHRIDILYKEMSKKQIDENLNLKINQQIRLFKKKKKTNNKTKFSCTNERRMY